jgi:cell division protease FtsH
MVREFGLSPALGPVGYPMGGSVYLGGGGAELSSRPFAEQTQAAIDAEVSRLLVEAEKRAVDVLTAHRDALDQLVQLLVTEETVDGAEIYALAGRPEPAGGASVTVAPNRPVSAPGQSLAAGPPSEDPT